MTRHSNKVDRAEVYGFHLYASLPYFVPNDNSGIINIQPVYLPDTSEVRLQEISSNFGGIFSAFRRTVPASGLTSEMSAKRLGVSTTYCPMKGVLGQ